MSALINSVVPRDGYKCLVTIQGKAPKQQFFESVSDLYDYGITASEDGKNAYYAMATFKTPDSRTQDNVQAIQAFWLDVDCKNKDPRVDYANKTEGMDAIRTFCKQNGFPRPTIVDSGNGWHIYWVLTEAITPDVWQPVADKLKSTCLRSGLRIDPSCTADSARILRIPDTFNFRFDPPSQVQLISIAKPIALEDFEILLNMAYDALGPDTMKLAGTPTRKELNAVTKALLNNTTSSFKKIMIRSASGSGCAQLLHAFENQATLEEPLWRAGLSIAQHCSDAATAIHKMSDKHPEYDAANTEEKAEATKGPYTCATFDGLRANVCTGCSHWGKLTSPIQLGKEVIAATEAVVVQLPKPEPKPAPSEQPVEAVHTNAEQLLAAFNQAQQNVVIPVPPAPYIRGANGGLYKHMRLEDGTSDDVLIYEHDFYVHARLYDPEYGQVLACRLHLPQDGVRNFTVPLSAVGAKDRLRELLCKQGIAATDKVIQELGIYMLLTVKELQQVGKEEKARTQMGWQEDNTFVLGAREYSATGIRHCPPSAATQNYQPTFTIEGDLEEWKKMLDFYDHPGFHVHQFLFFFMMGSPLLRFIREPGMLAAMISDESGLGKSTLGKLINSVWGHPVNMVSAPQDTINAFANRMGVFNSIGIYKDELTNIAPEQLSDLVYMSEHGRGKERMAAAANVERVNNTRWAQNTLVSANASIRDKISSIKAQNEGENMRLFEFDFRNTPRLDKELADRTFEVMHSNYGIAGHVYTSWMVANVGGIQSLVNKTRREMDSRFGFSSKERKWSAAIASAYTAWFIFYELGLTKWDVNANIRAMEQEINRMRGDVKASVTSHNGVLADFLADNYSSILVINGKPDPNGLQEPMRNRNINRILARYEPDTDTLYVSKKAFKQYCVDRQVSYGSLIQLTGGVETTKRIMQGTGVLDKTSNVVMFYGSVAGLTITPQDGDGGINVVANAGPDAD